MGRGTAGASDSQESDAWAFPAMPEDMPMKYQQEREGKDEVLEKLGSASPKRDACG